MKRVAAAAVALALLVSACGRPAPEAKARAADFKNAVYVGKKDGLPEAADPVAIKFNGEYYAYVTGDPCRVLKSQDLVNWTLVGNMLAEKANCWAPDVVYKNGTFYAYLSTELPDDEHRRRVRLYTSESPTGPFTLKATLTDRYSYDADYFMAPDGSEYLYWTEERGGNPTMVDRLVSMDKIAGSRTLVAEPEGWECKGRCILEGPSVIERDGYYYMQYSGAAYENASYGQGYVRSAVPMGPGGPKDTSWTKMGQILKTVELKVDGPGGGTWVKAPNNLDDWTIYHGRGITREDWDRWLRIDPVLWGRDRFWLAGAPSFEPRTGPGLPQFRDTFDQNGKPGKDWEVKRGTWEAAGGAVGQRNGTTAGALLLKGREATEYLFEANLRWAPMQSEPAGSNTAGIYAYYKDDKNYVSVEIDKRAQAVIVNPVTEQGKTPQTQVYPLPEGFRPEVWHQLMARKNGPLLEVYLDGRKLGWVTVPHEGPGRVGLFTAPVWVDFDGIALTHGWEDFFAPPAPMTWSGAAPFSVSPEGYLLKPAATQRLSVLKGAKDWGSYEFTASLRGMPGPLSSPTRYGLYATYLDEKNFVEVYIDPHGQALVTRPVLKGKPGEEQRTDIQIKPGEFHAITVQKNGYQFSFYLDGQLLQQRTIQLARGQVGLFGEGNEVHFDSVRAVRWD